MQSPLVSILTCLFITTSQAIPAPEPIDDPPFSFTNVAIKSRGSVSPGLNSRDTPSECLFPASSFQYYQFALDSGHTACMGWVPEQNCGFGTWSTQIYNDLGSAIAQQTAKTGALTETTVGIWTAYFLLGTTAFDDQTAYELFTQALSDGIAEDQRYYTWYFSYDNNYVSLYSNYNLDDLEKPPCPPATNVVSSTVLFLKSILHLNFYLDFLTEPC